MNDQKEEFLAEPRELLIYTLHERLNITGPHIGCETSHRGACTITMDDMIPDREERKSSLKGMGSSRKRVEDARFTQGKSNYVDDIKLDRMLLGDFVRPPYAHARVVKINIEAALKVPGVLAVLTAKDLESLNLHWMPTLAGNKQMVLANGEVLFQVQKVAFVITKDRFAAANGIEAVKVDY